MLFMLQYNMVLFILLVITLFTAHTAEHTPLSDTEISKPDYLHKHHPEILQFLLGDYNKHTTQHPLSSKEFLHHYLDKITSFLTQSHHCFSDVMKTLHDDFETLFQAKYPPTSWCNNMRSASCAIQEFFPNDPINTQDLKKLIILAHIAEIALSASEDDQSLPKCLTQPHPPTLPHLLSGIASHNPRIKDALLSVSYLHHTNFAIVYTDQPNITPLTHIAAQLSDMKVLPFPRSLKLLPSFGRASKPQEQKGCAFIFNVLLEQISQSQKLEFKAEIALPGILNHMDKCVSENLTQNWSLNGASQVLLCFQRQQRINWSLLFQSAHHLTASFASVYGLFNPQATLDSIEILRQLTHPDRALDLSSELYIRLLPFVQENFVHYESNNRQVLASWGIAQKSGVCRIEHIRALLVAYARYVLPTDHNAYYTRFDQRLQKGRLVAQKAPTFLLSQSIPFFIPIPSDERTFFINIPEKHNIDQEPEKQRLRFLYNLTYLYTTTLCTNLVCPRISRLSPASLMDLFTRITHK